MEKTFEPTHVALTSHFLPTPHVSGTHPPASFLGASPCKETGDPKFSLLLMPAWKVMKVDRAGTSPPGRRRVAGKSGRARSGTRHAGPSSGPPEKADGV